MFWILGSCKNKQKLKSKAAMKWKTSKIVVVERNDDC